MRVALVTACFIEGDGVGNTVAQKIDALEAMGHEVSLFVQRGAPPVPRAYATLARYVDLADVLDECLQARGGPFLDHDLFIVEFLLYYPLMEVVRFIPRGHVAVEYPGLTPVEHYRHEDFYRGLTEETLPRHDILDRADRILVHSHSMGEELVRLWPGAEGRIAVLPPAVSLDRFHPATKPSALARKLGLGGEACLLYVGRLAGNKRVDLLVDAAARLESHVPGGIRLLVVGDGATPPYDRYRKDLEAAVKKRKLEGRVQFVGKVAEEDLAAYYRLADVFVTASLHEGFCLPVVEAQASGVPVVASRCTALLETVGEGGLLFDPGDAEDCARVVATVLADLPAERIAWMERALASAKRFSTDTLIERLDCFLRGLGPARPRRPVNRREILDTLSSLPIQYHDVCRWPVVGSLLSRIRRRITLHLEKYYLRKLRRYQAHFNRLALEEVDRLEGEVKALREEVRRLEEGTPKADLDGRGTGDRLSN